MSNVDYKSFKIFTRKLQLTNSYEAHETAHRELTSSPSVWLYTITTLNNFT